MNIDRNLGVGYAVLAILALALGFHTAPGPAPSTDSTEYAWCVVDRVEDTGAVGPGPSFVVVAERPSGEVGPDEDTAFTSRPPEGLRYPCTVVHRDD